MENDNEEHVTALENDPRASVEHRRDHTLQIGAVSVDPFVIVTPRSPVLTSRACPRRPLAVLGASDNTRTVSYLQWLVAFLIDTRSHPSFLTRTSSYLARIAELCVPPASVWSSHPRRSIV